METASEQEPLLFESLMSSSISNEKQATISISMARQRTILQVFISIATTESVYHLLYIFLLFLTSVLISPHASPDPDLNAKWLKVQANIESALNIEICIFASFFLIRQAYGANYAVRVEQSWMRAEEPRRLRVMGLLFQLVNLSISALFILFPLYCRNCDHRGEKRRTVRVNLSSG